MNQTAKNRKRRGFSLVELLVVIAVIGVIAAIAIPAMSGIFGRSETTKTKRNAQQIASIYGGAKSAGNVATFADKSSAVTAVTQNTGMSGGGVFTGSKFVAPMSTTEATAAEAFLAYEPTTGMLTYMEDGGESVSAPDPNTNPWFQVGNHSTEASANQMMAVLVGHPNEHRIIVSGVMWIVQGREPMR